MWKITQKLLGLKTVPAPMLKIGDRMMVEVEIVGQQFGDGSWLARPSKNNNPGWWIGQDVLCTAATNKTPHLVIVPRDKR